MTQIFCQWCAVYSAFICMCYISLHRITKEFYSNHATYSKLIIMPYIVYVHYALPPARQQSREREQWLSRLETASKKELKLIGDPNSSKWSMEGELDFKAWDTVSCHCLRQGSRLALISEPSCQSRAQLHLQLYSWASNWLCQQAAVENILLPPSS